MTVKQARKLAKELSEGNKRVAVNVASGDHHLYVDGKHVGKKPGWVGGHTDKSECPCVRELISN